VASTLPSPTRSGGGDGGDHTLSRIPATSRRSVAAARPRPPARRSARATSWRGCRIPGDEVPGDRPDERGEHHLLGHALVSTIPLPSVEATSVEMSAPQHIAHRAIPALRAVGSARWRWRSRWRSRVVEAVGEVEQERGGDDDEDRVRSSMSRGSSRGRCHKGVNPDDEPPEAPSDEGGDRGPAKASRAPAQTS